MASPAPHFSTFYLSLPFSLYTLLYYPPLPTFLLLYSSLLCTRPYFSPAPHFSTFHLSLLFSSKHVSMLFCFCSPCVYFSFSLSEFYLNFILHQGYHLRFLTRKDSSLPDQNNYWPFCGFAKQGICL